MDRAAFKTPTDAHFYLPTGAPFHKVPYKDKKKAGQLRDATLKDAKEVGAARSVTSIQKFLAKPQLEIWGKNQIVEAIRRMWPKTGESVADLEIWIKAVIREAERVRQEAAERGDALHEALMAAARGETILEPYRAIVEAVQKALARYKIDLTAGESEVSFYSSEGYGGTIDWHGPAGLSENYTAILDYKSRELLDKKVRLAYPEKAMQLAAYRRAIRLPWADCYNVFVDMEANVCVHHWEEPKLRHEERRFLLLKDLVHATDNYKPTEEKRIVRIWRNR